VYEATSEEIYDESTHSVQKEHSVIEKYIQWVIRCRYLY